MTASVGNENRNNGVEEHPCHVDELAEALSRNGGIIQIVWWGKSIFHNVRGGIHLHGADSNIANQVGMCEYSRTSGGKTDCWVALSGQKNIPCVRERHTKESDLHAKERSRV